jgi:hypothetical protein
MNKKEVFIRNPARQIQTNSAYEAYVPEYLRLMAEGKLSGAPKENELLEHQAKIRAQAVKDLQMAPKIMIPSVGQQDLGWNKKASFYDEPLLQNPVYDDNFDENNLSDYELNDLHERLMREKATAQQMQPTPTPEQKKQNNNYNPPNSLDQLNNNEIIIIVSSKVIFSSLEEGEIKDKLASLIFEENINPDDVLVIKRLPINISINLS